MTLMLDVTTSMNLNLQVEPNSSPMPFPSPMSSLRSIISNTSKPAFDEHRWVINIRRILEQELEYASHEIPISIFNVPKPLMSSDPNLYTPQIVSIGPYHHCRSELFEMQRYKLDATKMIKKHVGTTKFQHLVDQVIELEPRIRSCYHKFIDFSSETLAWMMVIDTSFLLHIFQVYSSKEGEISLRISHLVDNVGRRSAHNAILRDIMMLENQIPLFMVQKVLHFQFSSLELADKMLNSMLLELCNELSPLKMAEDKLISNLSESAHLLDVLYDFIVPKTSLLSEITEEFDEENSETSAVKENSSHVKQFIKRLIFSRPMKVLIKIPCLIISNLPGFSIFKAPITTLFEEEHRTENGGNSNSHIEKPPLMEEIAVPSVTELHKSGVEFIPTNGNILTLNFDVKTFTFYLPMVNLDVNTEVVLRNLVAYEASSSSGPLIFTRYTELMNGIIDTEDDVKLMREKRVILNRLKSDEEAAKLWNGMSKSIRLTKVDFLDKVIEDLNKHYNGRLKIKVKKYMKQYVYASWPILTLFAAIFVLIMMGLQGFCSVYRCVRVFKT